MIIDIRCLRGGGGARWMLLRLPIWWEGGGLGVRQLSIIDLFNWAYINNVFVVVCCLQPFICVNEQCRINSGSSWPTMKQRILQDYKRLLHASGSSYLCKPKPRPSEYSRYPNTIILSLDLPGILILPSKVSSCLSRCHVLVIRP